MSEVFRPGVRITNDSRLVFTDPSMFKWMINRLFGYMLTVTRGRLGQSDWRGLSPIDPSPWCSTPNRFFRYLEVRIGRLDDRPALLH
jgi:hypothetical protein